MRFRPRSSAGHNETVRVYIAVSHPCCPLVSNFGLTLYLHRLSHMEKHDVIQKTGSTYNIATTKENDRATVTGKQTDTQTNMLITVLRSFAGAE